LPTDEFWTFAFLTPISVIFWGGAAVFITWLHSFGWVWWQNALAFLAFWGVWGGFVERWSRKHLARRRPSQRALSDDAPAGRLTPALSPPERALVPSQEPPRKLQIVATAEFLDYAF